MHRKIIDALKAKNPALAEFLTKEHLEGAKTSLLDFLRKNERRGCTEYTLSRCFKKEGRT